VEASPNRARRRYEWRRAWKAIGLLIADPKRTDQVFEVLDALSGPSFEGQFRRFAATVPGRRLLAERPSLLATLSDHDALRALPQGSFGRAYLGFMEAGRLSAVGLVEADDAAASRSPHERETDPDRLFYGDRLRDMHDLWHVLTGYGMDEAGEAANLAFTFAQIPNLGIGVIVVAGMIVGPKSPWLGWPRYLFRAWQRGRRAEDLTVAPYEEMLALPLEEARRRLGVEPAEIAHPGGIVVGSRGGAPVGDDPPSTPAMPLRSSAR
jgi:ubiquinone biosynthesis protein COQ4